MPWVRLDDEFASNPKVLEAGPLGMALQVAALCYCNRHLTDGRLPRPAAASLLSFEGIGMRMWSGELVGGGEDASWQLVAEDLVAAGIWHEPGHDCPECPEIRTGFYLHAYLDFQPSKAEVEAAKKKKSEAGKAGAAARWDTPKDSNRHGTSHSNRHGTPDATEMAERCPDPDPDPQEPPPQGSSLSTGGPNLKAVEEDERLRQCWGTLAKRKLRREQTQGRGPTNERAWLTKVAANDRAERYDEAVELIGKYPGISTDHLAQVLNGEREILKYLPRANAS